MSPGRKIHPWLKTAILLSAILLLDIYGKKTHTFVLGSMHINQSSIVIKQKKIVIILENM